MTKCEERQMLVEDAELFTMMQNKGELSHSAVSKTIGYIMAPEAVDELEVLRKKKSINIYPSAVAFLVGSGSVVGMVMDKIPAYAGIGLLIACSVYGMSQYIPMKVS